MRTSAGNNFGKRQPHVASYNGFRFFLLYLILWYLLAGLAQGYSKKNMKEELLNAWEVFVYALRYLIIYGPIYLVLCFLQYFWSDIF